MRTKRGEVAHLDVSLQLAAEIRSERQARGWTRHVLAESASISPETLTKIELGKTIDPGLFVVEAIATAMGTTIDTLLAAARRRAIPVTPLDLRMNAGIVSIGYEGRTIEVLVRDLKARNVSVVADVRLNAISRRPGLSKTALTQALAGEGIRYEHLRALGNPKDNRAGFATAEPRSRARMVALLKSDQGTAALAQLRTLAQDRVVAVLCFERDQGVCHRDVVIDELRHVDPRLAVHHA